VLLGNDLLDNIRNTIDDVEVWAEEVYGDFRGKGIVGA
jgi:hypothetical protein